LLTIIRRAHDAKPLRDGPLEKCWGGWGKNRKKIHANKKDLKKNTCIRLV
jgi:hypothetical protein